MTESVSDHARYQQIVDAYGNNESIVSNCHVRIAFAPNQVETAELLSRMTGTQTVQKASYNFSGSRFSPVMGHIDASVNHIERSLVTPDEVLRLKPLQKQAAGDTEKIVAPGQMLVFVSGTYPILGTQMLYFLDPVLTARVSVQPPTKFFAIEDGRVRPQKSVAVPGIRSANRKLLPLSASRKRSLDSLRNIIRRKELRSYTDSPNPSEFGLAQFIETMKSPRVLLLTALLLAFNPPESWARPTMRTASTRR